MHRTHSLWEASVYYPLAPEIIFIPSFQLPGLVYRMKWQIKDEQKGLAINMS